MIGLRIAVSVCGLALIFLGLMPWLGLVSISDGLVVVSSIVFICWGLFLFLSANEWGLKP